MTAGELLSLSMLDRKGVAQGSGRRVSGKEGLGLDAVGAEEGKGSGPLGLEAMEAGEGEGVVGVGSAEVGPGFADLGAEGAEGGEEAIVDLKELGHPLQVVGDGIGFGAGVRGGHGNERGLRTKRAESRRGGRQHRKLLPSSDRHERQAGLALVDAPLRPVKGMFRSLSCVLCREYTSRIRDVKRFWLDLAFFLGIPEILSEFKWTRQTGGIGQSLSRHRVIVYTG